MKKTLVLILVLLALVGLASCGPLTSLLPGGQTASTAASLWSDVPPFPGAAKVNIELPAIAQLIIQTAIGAGSSDQETKLDRFDFVVYETTATPEEVSAFYSSEKMTASGWTDTELPGCAGTSDSPQLGFGGAFCIFGKKTSDTQGTALVIIPTQDEQTKKTQIFYVRVEFTQTQ